MLKIGQPMKAAAHRTLAHVQDDSILLLISGEVSIRVCSQAGNELILKACLPGEFLLAPPTISNDAFFIRHVCEEASSFRISSRAECMARSGADDAINHEIKAEQHRLTLNYLRVLLEIAFMPTAQRLYSEILRQDASAKAAGGSKFLLRTHQVLANALATSRETISREIGFLRRQGVIELDGRFARLLDRGFLIRKVRAALDLTEEDDVLRSIGLA